MKILRKFLIEFNKKITSILVTVSPVLASKYLYRLTTGKKLNLKNPKNLNEKIQWLKLYWRNPLVLKCADKYEVRDYVKKCSCEEILNELYGVYENVTEINWNQLPDKFVLKTTNACGTNILCKNKKKIGRDKTFKKLKKWMKIDYGKYFAEVHYSKMKPRIICEKYLETKKGFLPNDYKIYCFNGEPKVILVCLERDLSLKLIFLDLSWKRINIDDPLHKLYHKGEIPLKPSCFNEMIKYSRRLSKPFPFVRIDFYDYKSKPLLGEMTFTPYGGILTYHNDKALEEMGSHVILPEKI